MADPNADPLAWLLGPVAPAPQPEAGFASWLVDRPPATGAPAQTPDEWSVLGLTTLALATAREWAADLAASQQPGASRGLQLVAPTLQQLLVEVRTDPRGFQARSDRAQAGGAP